jgi:hypothetical protein
MYGVKTSHRNHFFKKFTTHIDVDVTELTGKGTSSYNIILVLSSSQGSPLAFLPLFTAKSATKACD